jgi:limonene-1,2-epoxide hydrolase
VARSGGNEWHRPAARGTVGTIKRHLESPIMPSPIETVTAFCAEWGKNKQAMFDSFHRYFTPTTVWENVGLATTTGIDEALGLMQGFEGVETIRVDMVTIAADGNKVLTERVDTMVGADGKDMMGIRLMGIFEVEGDKIAAWRDYFDTAVMTQAS